MRKAGLICFAIILFVPVCGLFLAEYITQGRQFLFSAGLFFAPVPTEINPNFIKQVNECFIPTASVYGYTLRITTGFRSMVDQEELYQTGRTINGHIVTEAEAGKSIHNYGYAVDVVDRYRGYNINWEKLVKIGEYCGLESGGEGDLPHFEERAGLTTTGFEIGMRPPLLTLPCAIMDGRAIAGEKLTLKDLLDCNAPKF